MLTLIILTIVVLFNLPLNCPAAIATHNSEIKNVLVLHASHKGLSWNDRLSNGIESVFSQSQFPVRIFYEYMDTDRIFDNQHVQNLYELYKHKFSIVKFDAAIVTDDRAFQFMLNYHSRLLPGTPVIFCGVNYFASYDLYGQSNFTGIVQTIDIDETLDLVLTLTPKVRNAFVVVDKTPTSIAAIQLFIENMHTYQDRLSFYFNEDMDMRELINTVAELPTDWVVIVVNFIVDKSGQTYSIEQSTQMITQKAKVPVYSFWDSYLGNGIIGGKLISGLGQGKQSAQMVLKVFEGESPSQIDIIRESPNEYMFDYHVLEKFQIDMELLPEDSKIINKPSNIYNEYKTVIWSILIGFVLFIVIIFTLLINIFRRRQAEIIQKKYSNQLEIQNKIDRAILEAKPTEKIANDALKYVRNLFQCRRVSVILFDYEQRYAVVLAVNCDHQTTIGEKTKFPLKNFPVDDLKEGNIIYANDIISITEKSIVDKALIAEKINAYVRIPLMYHGTLIGALTLGHSDFSVFSDEKIETVKQISTSLALAIQATIFVNNILHRERDLKKMSAILIRSQEDERKKISLELHDEFGQALTAMNMSVSLLEKKVISGQLNDHKIIELLHDITGSIHTMADQIRDLSHELRPPMLDVLGLLPALKAHITSFQKRTGISVQLMAEQCEAKLPPEIEINLFRIIQEALHNVVKHASSSEVAISLQRYHNNIHLTITDNGKGFHIPDAHSIENTMGIGILGMQKRSTNLGGNFNIYSTVNIGTRIVVELPLNE
ncbi:ABC transporter substrate binding protein [Desulfopila aestuarii]|uniref:histidine kinase n=1 Tax=Desulfopila aestuarii DSM 18488 TaxID=1121416 RepID=A0A1M7XXU7_9BACT|nr:ABC transporter substrate binding protein [Desulfopila aestuarii]SHO43774.1 GAF domain-containing protein [Desulfopila aestuarii DSM 18488]